MVKGKNKYRIKDIFDLSAGGDVDKEHFSAYKTSEYRYPIYSNSLENHGLYGYTSNPKYSADSVTITGRGSVGHAEYREDEFDAIIRLLVLKPKSNNVCAQFVADYINNCVEFPLESTGVPQLTAPQIMNVELELPQYDEQKEVTTVLAGVSSLIDMLDKQIAKKKAIKQGTMQELLTGKRRLPGFSEKWEEKPISFFGNFVSGNCFPIKYQGCPSGELPFYKVSDFNNIGNSRVMDKANNYISHNVASVLSCKIIPKNSVVFAKIGAAISLERKRITGCDCCIDNNMMSFLPYQKNIATYMCYLLQTIRFGEFVEATALPSLSGKTIGEIQRTFPPTIEEQIAIATVLSDLDSEIEALEQKLTKYRQVKQGMMQQLLTGKIRLV